MSYIIIKMSDSPTSPLFSIGRTGLPKNKDGGGLGRLEAEGFQGILTIVQPAFQHALPHATGVHV